MRVYATVETNVEKKNVLLSLGAASTPELKLRTMQWSLEEVKLQDFFYPFYSVSSAGPEGRDIAFKFVTAAASQFLVLLRYYMLLLIRIAAAPSVSSATTSLQSTERCAMPAHR